MNYQFLSVYVWVWFMVESIVASKVGKFELLIYPFLWSLYNASNFIFKFFDVLSRFSSLFCIDLHVSSYLLDISEMQLEIMTSCLISSASSFVSNLVAFTGESTFYFSGFCFSVVLNCWFSLFVFSAVMALITFSSIVLKTDCSSL